jgi:hypothetical protein
VNSSLYASRTRVHAGCYRKILYGLLLLVSLTGRQFFQRNTDTVLDVILREKMRSLKPYERNRLVTVSDV